MHTPPFQSLWETASQHPEWIAIRCGSKQLTYAEFLLEILRAEAGLRSLGVKRGELVTILTLNTPESLAAFYAVDRIGAVANWVDMKLSPGEVESYLTDSGSSTVLVLEPAAEKVFRYRGSAPAVNFIVLPLQPYIPQALASKLKLDSWRQTDGLIPWKHFLRTPSAAEPDVLQWNEILSISYTGGTTGPAKGVTLSRKAFHTSLEQYRIADTLSGPETSVLTLLPVFSAYGLCQCMHLPLCFGMTLILTPMFQADHFATLLMQYRPEQVNGTTSYWLQLTESDIEDLSFLRVLRCGGDLTPAETEKRIVRFIQSHGCTGKFINEYGLSETCGMVSMTDGSESNFGSVGLPLYGNEFAVIDVNTGNFLPAGEEGEVILRSDTVMLGYYKKPEADSQVLRPGPDGRVWLWTKDWGSIDNYGRLHITGRIKRMISRNGFKIFPSVIEDFLMKAEEVESCAVVSGKNRQGETVPIAFLTVSPNCMDPDSLKTRLLKECRKNLNLFLVPNEIHIISSFPLTERGKLDYLALESTLN